MISIIMSTYNEDKEELKLCLDSIINQTEKSFEIIIVIDNPDNKEIKFLLEEYERKDKRIKLLKNKTNLGLAKSLNRAFLDSKGEYIARMDADDIMFASRLEEQLSYMRKNDVDILGCDAVIIDELGIEKKDFIKPKNKILINLILNINNCFIHPTLMMKRKVFLELNGYRNFVCSQDYDFILRARDKGFNLRNASILGIKYRIRSKSLSNSRGLEQMLLANYMKKLSMERKKTKEDSFDENKVLDIINSITRKRRENYTENRSLKRWNKIKVLRKSKDMRALYMNLFKYELLMLFDRVVQRRINND